MRFFQTVPGLGLALILAFAAGSFARPDDPVLPGSQAQPGRLDASLAHETRAALDRGMAWLAARQQPDGGWAPTNRPALTALPVLLFSFSPDPGARKFHERGKAFLAPLAPPTNPDGAWAVMALTQCLDRAAAIASSNVGARLFVRLAEGAKPADPELQRLYAWLAAHPGLFKPERQTVEELADRVLLVMALAQAGKNRLAMADQSLLTWRPLIARALINRQKVDPGTGGLYWTPDGSTEPADTLAATCYALLTLQVVLAE